MTEMPDWKAALLIALASYSLWGVVASDSDVGAQPATYAYDAVTRAS